MKPWPDSDSATLHGCRVPAVLLPGHPATDEFARCDIALHAGRIAAIAAELPPGPASIQADGIVVPGFADLHTHIDKGHIWPRAPNADGSHTAAVRAVKADREANWSVDDVAARADFSLRCAYAHGTVALRTHLDSLGDQLHITWPLFRRLRAEWAGRIALQGVSLVQLDATRRRSWRKWRTWWRPLAGCSAAPARCSRTPALIRRVFDLAVDRNLDIDLHVDETGDPAAQTLRLIAQEAIARNYHGRVTCGHCCSLAVQDPAEARRTIAMVAEAGITVVSLPW